MAANISVALRNFTQHYCQQWLQQQGHLPASEALYGLPSPCIVENRAGRVLWQPQPFSADPSLSGVERALSLRLQPDVVSFYTSQFAGDMQVVLDGRALTLLQVWNEEDFLRIQENLIGHLVMKRQLKQTPTLFIATTESDWEVVSLCNLSGEVILENLRTQKRQILAPDIEIFLTLLQTVT